MLCDRDRLQYRRLGNVGKRKILSSEIVEGVGAGPADATRLQTRVGKTFTAMVPCAGEHWRPPARVCGSKSQRSGALNSLVAPNPNTTTVRSHSQNPRVQRYFCIYLAGFGGAGHHDLTIPQHIGDRLP